MQKFEQIEKELDNWDESYLNLLIFNLLKKGKLKYSEVSKQYVQYLESEKEQQRNLTAELAMSLVQHRNPKLVVGKNQLEKKEFMDNKALSALRRTKLFPEEAEL